MATGQVDIADAGIPSITLTAINNTSCGPCNGEVRVNVNCMDDSYYISWNTESDEPLLTGLCAGTYEAAVQDRYGNEASASVTIIDEVSCKSSGSESLAVSTASELTVKAYPNPFLHSATVEFHADKTQKVLAELIGADGRRVAVMFDGFANEDETYAFNINGDELSPGMYLFRLITDDGRVQVTRMSLLK